MNRAVIIIAAGMATSIASAQTFDFGALFGGDAVPSGYAAARPVAGDFDGGVPNTYQFSNGESLQPGFRSESAFVYYDWMQPTWGGNITLTATAEDDGGQIFVYGDSKSGGKAAGLGAVQPFVGNGGINNTTSLQANPSDADNAAGALSEIVVLSASRVVTLTGATFVDADHNPLDGSNVLVDIDGSGYVYDGNDSLRGTTFKFKNATSGGQFYVSIISVPTPGAVTLAGIGGLIALRRKR